MSIISRFRFDGCITDEYAIGAATGHNVKFTGGVDDKPEGAVVFNGKNSYITITNNSYNFGKSDFFIGMWTKFPENSICCGDLISKYDANKGKGWGLTINGTSGGYGSISESRNVYFGIDDGFQNSWGECGAPCDTNTLISSMCVYRGELYVGIADAVKDEDACRVYKYAGGKRWTECGRLGNDPKHRTAFSLTVHNGRLYASNGIWDYHAALGKVNLSCSHVFCYEGGTDWRDCGQVGSGFRIMALASHNGDLYASSDSSNVFRYLGGERWEFAGGSGSITEDKSEDSSIYRLDNLFFRLDTLLSFKNDLYGGGKSRIFKHMGGSRWECFASGMEGVTQVHKLQNYGGYLYAGTWPYGKVLRFEDDGRIVNTGDLGDDTGFCQSNEVNDLVYYNGKLYAGVLPKAELYRYDGDGNWKVLRSHESPEYLVSEHETWRRITSMAVYDGKLFFSPSSVRGFAESQSGGKVGNVFTYESGVTASYDSDVGTGWHHIAVCKKNGRLIVFLDGHKKSVSHEFDPAKFDLNNDVPLRIGYGTLNYINAAVDDLVIAGGEFDADSLARECAYRVEF